MINPEAPIAPPRIAQPVPPPAPSYNTRTVTTSATRGNQAIQKPAATLLPIPAGKPATSVSAPGGMISQAPAGTRPPTSQTRGNQTPAAMQSRAAVPAPAPAAPAPAAPAPAATGTAPTTQKPEKYAAPEGYDRTAAYRGDASPDQILFEKEQIRQRQLSIGNELSDQEIELRFRDRLKTFQDTGDPSKDPAKEFKKFYPGMTYTPSGEVSVPGGEVAAPEVPSATEPIQEQAPAFEAMQSAFTAQIQQLQQQIQQLVDQIAKLQSPAQTQATATTPAATSPATTPVPGTGSPAGMDQVRIAQFYQIAAPMMFTGTFQQVVDAIVSAGLTPTDAELAWLESEIARVRAG